MRTNKPGLTTRSLLRHGGKVNFELNRLAARGNRGRIVYVTTKAEIENLDLSRFVITFGPRIQPEEALRMRARILFVVEGYDADSAELFEIPAVRRYYAQADKRWPAWCFYADLASECLAMVAACIIPRVVATRRTRRRRNDVHILHSDLTAFFARGLTPVAFLHKKVGISEQEGAAMLGEAARYLRLPEA